ncbi:MAG: gamma-glutamylcyclotransferase family protein [Mizugakiibacter sp.]|uniref:gamma-glutamylcyclotransferase family protein n=1 Tax=Mizugakiibacter sp. TaxID=1972610 RepID=UPI0031CAC248|nr:gamma-glutamylcyclotransferase [Xanthomonadaceae bacterium]
MTTIRYFTYGPNLLRERLLACCPGVVHVGRAALPDNRLVFDKASADGSSKCAFESAEGEAVHGVLWDVPEDRFPALNLAEGTDDGYKRCMVEVVPEGGGVVEVLAYRALRRWVDVPPYDWYLALVVAGAQQQGLPQAYIERLRATPFVADDDLHRAERVAALALLQQAGMANVLASLAR